MLMMKYVSFPSSLEAVHVAEAERVRRGLGGSSGRRRRRRGGSDGRDDLRRDVDAGEGLRLSRNATVGPRGGGHETEGARARHFATGSGGIRTQNQTERANEKEGMTTLQKPRVFLLIKRHTGKSPVKIGEVNE